MTLAWCCLELCYIKKKTTHYFDDTQTTCVFFFPFFFQDMQMRNFVLFESWGVNVNRVLHKKKKKEKIREKNAENKHNF